MGFPHLHQFLWYDAFILLFFLPFSIFFFSYSASEYVQFLRGKPVTFQWKGSEKPAGHSIVMAILVGLLFCVVAGGVIFRDIFAFIKFRSIQPKNLTGLVIKHTTSGETHHIFDVEVIRNGLLNLKECSYESRMMKNKVKANFSNDFQISFIENKYIYTYGIRIIKNKEGAHLITPYVLQADGILSPGSILGVYSCPSFLQWMEKHTDPLFAEP